MKQLVLILLLSLSYFSFSQDKNYFDGRDSCSFEVNNMVTPNGDDIDSEKFWVKTSCQLHEYKLQVFNRWGVIIFKTTSINEKWDCGDEKSGTFYYILSGKYLNNEEFTVNGYFQLLL